MALQETLRSIAQDARFGLRGLWRDRGFAAVAILTLALGIGANSAIYTLVDGVLLRALPYRETEQLVALAPEHSFMRAEYALARDQLQTVSLLAAYQPGVGVSVSGERDAVRLVGALISANLLETLGVTPLGRSFEAEHELANRDDVALISYRLWQSWYGGDPGVLGRTLQIDGSAREIIGILPQRFTFPHAETDVWLPLTIDPAQLSTYWGVGGARAVGRLRASATAAQVQTELRGLGDALRLANPFWTPNPGYRSDNIVLPLQDALVGNTRTMLLVLFGAVLLVWLIACANVGNLMLARGLARGRELAVRLALGAGRGRIIRQLLTESASLAIIGGAAGLLLGWLLLRTLLPLMPADLPRLEEVRLDARVLSFTLLASLTAACVFGLLPALNVSRLADATSLRSGTRAGAGTRQRRLSASVVVAEVALAVVLVAGAGLLLRSLQNLSHVDTGFATERIVTARLSPPAAQYRDAARRWSFYQQVVQRLQYAPRVHEVALTKQLPFDGELSLTAAAVEFVATDPNELPVFEHRAITPAYFRTLQMPLLEGRAFDDADDAAALPVAIVDRATAERFWPGESALGKRLGRPWLREWRTVVGVVGTVRNNQLKGEATPAFYVPLAQEPSAAAVLALRTAAPADQIASLIRAAVREADAGVPVSHITPLQSLVSAAAGRERMTALLVTAFAALALLLGAVGLYGVLAYAVTQRTHELSVRCALGATRRDLLTMVLREGMLLGAVGIMIGLPAASAIGHALRSQLFGVGAADLNNLSRVTLVLLGTCVLAALIPALRAVRAQPAAALRG